MERNFTKVEMTSPQAKAYPELYQGYREKLAAQLLRDAKTEIQDDTFIAGIKAAKEAGVDVDFALGRLGVAGNVWASIEVSLKISEWEYGNELPDQESRELSFECLATVLQNTKPKERGFF